MEHKSPLQIKKRLVFAIAQVLLIQECEFLPWDRINNYDYYTILHSLPTVQVHMHNIICDARKEKASWLAS